MITVFLQLYFKMLRDLMKFIADRVTKELEYVFQKGRNYGDEDTERGDFYVKEIVDNLTEERGYGSDPNVIDDRKYGFFRIPVLAEAVHLGTYINGLKSLHRADICAITGKAGKLSINASLGAGPLELSSMIFVKLAFIERLLAIKLSLKYCKVHTNFSIDARTGRNGSLKSVCIDELRGVSFSVTGFGWLYLPSLFVTLFMKLFKSLVRNILEFKLEQHFNETLPSYQFPIEVYILANPLISELTNVDNINELVQIIDDSDSREIDEESLNEHQTFVSKTISPKHTNLRKPIWCTNLPLFEDIVEEQGICNDEYDESDISIQFQFSKDNVIQEDIEPLTRSERPTCCVFFRSEVLQSCNETSESFKSHCTEVSRYEDLKDKKLRQNSRFEDFSPVKHSKDFLGLLTKDLSPVVSGGPNLPGSEETTVPCNLEATEGENERLIRRFLVSYPKFVAFTRHTDEMAETGDSIKNSLINAEIKMPTDVSNIKVYTTINEERYSGHLEKGSQNNPIQISASINNATDFTEAKYLELCELTTAKGKKTEERSELYKDNLYFGKSSGTCKIPCFNKDSKQNISQNFKHVSDVEYEEFVTQSEDLLDRTVAKNPAINSIGVEKTQNFNQMERVESIMKWDKNMEDINTLISENIDVTLKMSSQKSESSLISVDRTRRLKDALVKTDESINTYETVFSLKKSPSLREENNNEIASSIKYDTRTTNDRLDFIGDSVFRCFENSCTNLLSSPYFSDIETNFSKLSNSPEFQGEMCEQFALLEDSSLIKVQQEELKDSITERFQIDEINDNINNAIKRDSDAFKCRFNSAITDLTNTFELLSVEGPVATSEEIWQNFPIVSFNENGQFSSFPHEQFIGYSIRSLNEGNDQTKDSEKGDTLVGKEELKSDINNIEPELVLNYETIDEDDFYEWFSDYNSDDQSVDVSSDSDKEEVDMGKPILCKEFVYIDNCLENEIKQDDLVIAMEKPSSVEIAENSGSEESLLNSSSTLNTEALNFKDALRDSNAGKISQETLINMGGADIQINANLNALNIDSVVKLDEKSTDFYNGEAIDSSTKKFRECTTNFGLEETHSGKESDTDCMKMTESNMDAQTSKECSVELHNFALTESFEEYLPPSLHEDDCSKRLQPVPLIKTLDIKYMQEASSLSKTIENRDEIPIEEIHLSDSNESIKNFLKLPDELIESYLNGTTESNEVFSNVSSFIEDYLTQGTDILNEMDFNGTKTVLFRQAMIKLDRINDLLVNKPVSQSDDQLCANILSVATENIANCCLVLEGNKDNLKENY